MPTDEDHFDAPDPKRAAQRLGKTPGPVPPRDRTRRSLLGTPAPVRRLEDNDTQPTLIPSPLAPPVAITQPTAAPEPPPLAAPPPTPPVEPEPPARRSPTIPRPSVPSTDDLLGTVPDPSATPLPALPSSPPPPPGAAGPGFQPWAKGTTPQPQRRLPPMNADVTPGAPEVRRRNSAWDPHEITDPEGDRGLIDRVARGDAPSVEGEIEDDPEARRGFGPRNAAVVIAAILVIIVLLGFGFLAMGALFGAAATLGTSEPPPAPPPRVEIPTPSPSTAPSPPEAPSDAAPPAEAPPEEPPAAVAPAPKPPKATPSKKVRLLPTKKSGNPPVPPKDEAPPPSPWDVPQ